MNQKQQITLGCGFFTIFFVAIYPPWHTEETQHSQSDIYVRDRQVGRGLLWSPPRYNQPLLIERDPFVRVDGEQLLAEIAAIVSLTGLVVVAWGLLRSGPNKLESSHT